MKNALVKNIQPYAARMITSPKVLKFKRRLYEYKRRLSSKPHRVDVFLRINDPYSYLLVQVMAEFSARFHIEIRYRTIRNLQDDMYPEKSMWHENGFIDATHLARLYGLKCPDQMPNNSADLVTLGTERLLHLEQQPTIDWPLVESVFHNYWLGSSTECSVEKDAALLDRLLDRLLDNEQALLSQGHYMSAMLYYAGEWYWGLDRLDHLEKRLNELGLANSDEKVLFDRTYHDFCSCEPLVKKTNKTKKLTLFFSIRSPYSHLALVQALKLAKHYCLEFEIKPVLPMIMRGLLVPDTKKMYIFHDTKREASKLGIDYGFVADPLGKGVENCYALFQYAKSIGKENLYLLHYAQAVNAQGVHSDTDKGLKSIVEKSGMDWSVCQDLLRQSNAKEMWMIWADANRLEMEALGSWGVPTFQYGDLVLWGQDRIGLIELAIKEDVANTE